ncbi:pentatricopeptide repeat-containing protein At1g77360, mitochondrial [Lotus japonicus]|uniref:pentatricopeptide repeat-containing protein At1g77360, mitochondrial n=1 Tax=Lotus japonicus TaxID=34305 RepID=UPI002589C862|nr:pentatricopeptide repeat-containing protein At1g77360, mitochondrial [Lotus japonicus]
MIKICNPRKKLLCKFVSFARMLSTGEPPPQEVADLTETVCKVMMSSPGVTLDAALNQTGVRASPELVENVLKRFENAGMSAFRFFEWAERQRNYAHTVRAYHLMIESLARIRQYQIMWDIVTKMRNKGMLNVETFCIVMRKYARAHKVDEAVYTFNVMDKYEVPQNLAAFNGLLSALCKSRNVRKAQEIFDSMKGRFEPDLKTYSILLEGWGKDPNLPKARETFREMVSAGCSPDVVSYGIMVDILCKAGRVDEAVEVVKDMDDNNCMPTSFIYSVLVHTYGVENRIEDAIDTFLEMERKGIKADVVVYNALIGAFCKANKFKNVRRVLKEMESNGVTPNSRTCNVIISSLISQGRTDRAFEVFRRMIKICEPDADTYTMMIKMFCERNEMDMAMKIWKYMKSKRFVPSLHTFSALINGLCQNGNAMKACVLLEEMIEKGIRPSRVTFGKLRQLLIKEKREDVLTFLHEKINLLVKEPLCD